MAHHYGYVDVQAAFINPQEKLCLPAASDLRAMRFLPPLHRTHPICSWPKQVEVAVTWESADAKKFVCAAAKRNRPITVVSGESNADFWDLQCRYTRDTSKLSVSNSASLDKAQTCRLDNSTKHFFSLEAQADVDQTIQCVRFSAA